MSVQKCDFIRTNQENNILTFLKNSQNLDSTTRALSYNKNCSNPCNHNFLKHSHEFRLKS